MKTTKILVGMALMAACMASSAVWASGGEYDHGSATIPEPSVLALTLAGVIGAGVAARAARNKKK
ncbi:MAG: hypothetical protein GC138_06935 [Gammaproteobacteria bacterium]|nr:hypothetical protein [Gammaproteobacteria bacterium]